MTEHERAVPDSEPGGAVDPHAGVPSVQGTASVGHPIDVATGNVWASHEDISITGRVALTWERRYNTGTLNLPASPLGPGWNTRYFATLTKVDKGFRFATPEGGVEVFSDPSDTVDDHGTIRNLGTFQEISKPDGRYIVTRWNVDTGSIERYVFRPGRQGEAWPLVSIEDVTGQGLDMLRDKTGRLTGIQQRLEMRTLLLHYTDHDRIKSVSFVIGNQHHVLVGYEYDSLGRLVSAYDALSNADFYEYDEASRLIHETAKDGGGFYFKYDQKGRCIKTSGLDRYDEKTLRYLDAIRWTEVTDSRGHVTRYQWLPSGQVVTEIDPSGGIRTTEYDDHGRITARIDATGAPTRYTYDELGNRPSVTDAAGGVHQFAYNDQHLPVTMTDPIGGVWKRVYDTSNRVLATSDPLGNQWTIRYDREGNVVEIRNPLGAIRRRQYEHGVVSSTTDPLGHATRFRWDPLGRLTERIGPLGEVTRFQYDMMSNPVEVTLPDGATLRATYDSVGNLTSHTDGNGHVTRFSFGPGQRLRERVDPTGGVIRYIWGSEPRHLEEIVNEHGESYRFVRDPNGRVIHEHAFDGAQRDFAYDAAGHVVAYTNANGETVNIERDGLHRVIARTLPDGERDTYGFDPIGNLATAVNADIAVTFERDALGRIEREVQGDHWVQSRYDAVGNLIRTVTSLGHVVDFEVSANGFVSRLTTVRNQSLDFTRNPDGQDTLREMPGGVAMERRYDDLGRLIDQRVSPGRWGNRNASVIPSQRDIIRRSYSYDRGSSLTSVVDGRWGRVDCVYDPAKQLLQAIRELGRSEAYTYDSVGNITSMRVNGNSANGEVLAYGPGSRLLQKGDTRYEYDLEGRLVRKIEGSNGSAKVWSYTWNALDQLRMITTPDGQVWKYRYDAFGRRVAKHNVEDAGSTTRVFVWDKEVVVHEGDGNGKSLSAWIFDVDGYAPIVSVQGGRLYAAITDHLGTPRELVDASGNVAWSISTTVWGETDSTSRRDHAAYCPLRFQGQWEDEETKLCYNFYRYYDPQTGRYVSQDPIGLIGGINLYRYAPNPLTWVDPLGLNYDVTGNTAGQDTLSRGAHVNVRGPGLPPRGGHVGFVPNAAGTGLVPVPVDAATRNLTANQSARLNADVVAHMGDPTNAARMRAQAQAGIDAHPGTARAQQLAEVRDILDEHARQGTNPCE
jgi:RHS repeat-associated protein